MSKKKEKPISLDNLPKPWTKRQFLFAEAYIGEADCVATKAAKIAGYSENTAYSIGSRLLREVEYSHVQDYIKQKLGALIENYDMSREAMLQRLGEITHSRLTDAVTLTEKGFSIKDTSEIPDRALGALKSISQKSGAVEELSVTMHDPIAAMKEAAKLQKLYEDLGGGIQAENVHIYIPDNGRDDPAHRPDFGKEEEEEEEE